MDNRGYPRIKASVPIEFHVRHLEATEEPWIGRGMLDNLSLTGIFFVPDDQPPLQQGDKRFHLHLISPYRGAVKPVDH
jgi:hypothetical protein